MSLSDIFNEEVQEDARRARSSHPKGFEPGVVFDPEGQPTEATISNEGQIDDSEHRTVIEEKTGLKVPENLRVVLERLTLNEDGRYWYKYKFVAAGGTQASDIDTAAILTSLRENREAVEPKYTAGEATMGLVWSDWQIGKVEGGGTPAFIQRADRAFAAAEARVAELNSIGRNISKLVIFVNGDIVEGCSIFPNQVWQLDCDTRKQMDIGVTVALEGLDRLAPLFEEVTVMVVGGNHGENRIGGNKVNNHDNRDVEMFENVAKAANRDPRLQHVNFVIAQSELVKTIDIHGWIFAHTHGQVFGRGSGAIEQRAYRWYAGQAAGHLPAGDANVLITSHYHHEAAADWGACLWKQSAHLDGGSQHFTDVSGNWSNPGMLSFVVTPEDRWKDQQIL